VLQQFAQKIGDVEQEMEEHKYATTLSFPTRACKPKLFSWQISNFMASAGLSWRL
jgi:hypothetical protein